MKKLRRIETGVDDRGPKSFEELQELLAEELADVIITACNVANFYGVDLDTAVPAKFNATSDKYGFPQHMTVEGEIVDG